MKVLTAFELDNLCIHIATSTQFYYSESNAYFEDLYHTGCRSSELLQIDRWKIIGDKVKLTTLKTEAPRILHRNVLSNSLITAIENRHKPYGYLTYDQLTLELRKVAPIHPVYCGKRIADTYLFRYNKARQMYANEVPTMAIMEYFGWMSHDVCLGYLHNQLTY